jgi:hypothetical protein
MRFGQKCGTMNPKRISTLLAVSCAMLMSGAALAGPKTYQVTGPVVQVTDTSIVVKKGQENWEIARDGQTKITGDLKVGAKVTITYTMTAVTVEAKPAKTDSKK